MSPSTAQGWVGGTLTPDVHADKRQRIGLLDRFQHWWRRAHGGAQYRRAETVFRDFGALPNAALRVYRMLTETTKPKLVAWAKLLIALVPVRRVELPTFALRMRCSTN